MVGSSCGSSPAASAFDREKADSAGGSRRHENQRRPYARPGRSSCARRASSHLPLRVAASVIASSSQRPASSVTASVPRSSPARKAGQVVLAGCVVAGVQHGVGGEHDAGEQGCAQQRPAGLLEHDARARRSRSRRRRTPPGSQGRAGPSSSPSWLPDCGVEALIGLHQPPYFGLRRPVGEEVADHRPQLFLLRAEREIHLLCSWFSAVAGVRPS